MTPSYRSLRRLAVGLLAVSTLAACGGDDQSVGPATVASDTSAVIDTVASETTAAPTDVTDTVANSSASTSEPTTTAGSVAVQAAATTTVATAGSPTTVKVGASTTTTKTVAPVTTTKPVVPAPAPTVPPATAPPASQPPAPATVSASCTGASRSMVRAKVGDFINLAVSSENGLEQEFHVHGYDITLGGMSVSFRFTADTVGSFIVESHDTKLVACTLVVS